MSFAPFDELAGYPIFDQQLAYAKATRIGKINWSDINAFANYLFPAGLSPKEFPGRPRLIARNLHVEPFIGENEKLNDQVYVDPETGTFLLNNYEDVNGYQFARVRIDYETPAYEPVQGDDPAQLLQHR